MTELPEPTTGTPLYVHLPFCAAKCHYCDFFSVPDEGQDIDGMVAAILREAEVRAAPSPRTVFLGGGTPSLLSAAQLKTLLDGLDRIVGWRDSAVEVTAECNPESLDTDKARAFLDLGVPRLSIGFQSLDNATLELYGRVHRADDSFRAYEAAREAGIQHLNTDLIYAAPNQTAADWESDLGRVLALGPDHLSAYNLTFEEDTRFKRWLDRGTLERTDEDVELEMFHTTRRLAADAGLEPYEISNYARPGEACEHNVNYWQNGEYVGIGPGAVSKVGVSRGGNPRGIAPYRRQIRESGVALSWSEAPTGEARLAESWWLGLRLAEGVDPAAARRAAQHDPVAHRAGTGPVLGAGPVIGAGPMIGSGPIAGADPAVAIALELVGHDLLEAATDSDGTTRYRLTERGRPLADAVARRFLDAVPAAGE